MGGKMEVDVYDTYMPNIPPGPNYWVWPINWEYVNLTVIPISTDGAVGITGDLWVTSDAAGNRLLHYNFQNYTQVNLDCFATLTVPNDSVS
ncbi:hypothetical protein SAMN04487926_11913 [Paraburkholderia steynii]|uniref:Uncharacterized protein n=1 Tax=Paraburkholderia steynii TaxID=1245441 RepID=A0A7Z7FJI2_9BURK|nr:hypothetical protein [Paraburkholderia steynii]SDI55129.1 hypothetical protein SAMN04487926_11913 [Paraburkholderia steynii]